MSGRRVAALLAALVISLTGCSSDDGPPLTRAECGRLQADFNAAMDIVEARPPGDSLRASQLSRAHSLGDQMQKGGCYR